MQSRKTIRPRRTWLNRCLPAALCAMLAAGGPTAARAGVFADWSYRLELAFPLALPGPVTNFPVMVTLGTNINGFAYDQFHSVTGADLRFSDAARAQELPYEIERWNTNGTSYVWVRVPQLSGANDRIYAYWGKEGAAAPGQAANVWTNGFGAVWHLSETNIIAGGTTGKHYDSTAYTNTGTQNFNASATGVFAGAQSFDGAGDYISCGTNASININPPRTISTWIKLNAHKNYQAIAGKTENRLNNTNQSYRLAVSELGSEYLMVYSPQSSWKTTGCTIKVSAGSWHHVVFESPGDGNMYYYVDGQAAGSTSFLYTDKVANGFDIGSYLASVTTYDLNGSVADMRLSNVARGGNWAYAEWLNGASNNFFVTAGTVAPGSSAGTIFTLR